MRFIIAYDLGPGGTKTSLFDEEGNSMGNSFYPCVTEFPRSGWHEQRPEAWWESVVLSTHEVLVKSGVGADGIAALAVSGHSLGTVPVSQSGELLIDHVPIWSDARADREAAAFFEEIDEERWYLDTGAGFPAPLYTLFKIMWYRNHMPELYRRTARFIGTKDYINWRLTGRLCTDRSYASGSGIWSLTGECYSSGYGEAAGIDLEKLPEVLPSTHVIGTLLPGVARELGLTPRVKVCAGGVDNACMALGAGCTGEGEAYTSLGTSSWIAVSSHKPIVNAQKRPYVFAHCIPSMYVSATAIFSAGNSLRWVRDTVCPDLVEAGGRGGSECYQEMDRLAAASPAGANRLIFNPSLAGGSSLDRSAKIRGCFAGLDLRHTRGDLIRATLEGVCLNLRLAMDVLSRYVPLSKSMLLVGGGGKSPLWRQLFASIYEKEIVETQVGQDAGSLGAAAVAAVGAGLWEDFSPLKRLHRERSRVLPNPADVALYRKMLPIFIRVSDFQSELGELWEGTVQEIQPGTE